MTLEEIIVANSKAPIAKLYEPSKVAHENPTKGIITSIPAVAPVIRDLALITIKYLPVYLFGLYGNPFTELSGKVSVDAVRDFVTRAQSNIETHHFLRLILDKGSSLVPAAPTAPTSVDDPYGEYNAPTPQQFMHDDVYILSKLFGVI